MDEPTEKLAEAQQRKERIAKKQFDDYMIREKRKARASIYTALMVVALLIYPPAALTVFVLTILDIIFNFSDDII